MPVHVRVHTDSTAFCAVFWCVCLNVCRADRCLFLCPCLCLRQCLWPFVSAHVCMCAYVCVCVCMRIWERVCERKRKEDNEQREKEITYRCSDMDHDFVHIYTYVVFGMWWVGLCDLLRHLLLEGWVRAREAAEMRTIQVKAFKEFTRKGIHGIHRIHM